MHGPHCPAVSSDRPFARARGRLGAGREGTAGSAGRTESALTGRRRFWPDSKTVSPELGTRARPRRRRVMSQLPGPAQRGDPGRRGLGCPQGALCPPGPAQRVTSRNARFQQWQALLGNRAERQRSSEFILQRMRPITLALRHGWQIRVLLYDADDADGAASRWARGTLAAVAATKVAASAPSIHHPASNTDTPPALLANA